MQTLLLAASNTSVIAGSVAMPTSTEVLEVYIGSAGIIPLCIERINTRWPGANYDEVLLHATLSKPDVLAKLQAAARAQIIMRTYETANQFLVNATLKMGTMPPADIAKTATQLLDRLDALTSTKSSDVNVNNFIFENVIPEEATAAINYLKQHPIEPPTNIIDYIEHE